MLDRLTEGVSFGSASCDDTRVMVECTPAFAASARRVASIDSSPGTTHAAHSLQMACASFSCSSCGGRSDATLKVLAGTSPSAPASALDVAVVGAASSRTRFNASHNVETCRGGNSSPSDARVMALTFGMDTDTFLFQAKFRFGRRGGGNQCINAHIEYVCVSE